jgi:HEAT repeat protein
VDAGEGNRPYSGPSARQEERIRALIDRLAAARGEEALDVGREILAVGEPALPSLVAALESPEARLRGHAAYLLGFWKDRRTLPAIARASADPDPLVRYEAAAARLELSDPGGFPILVAGLEDPDARLRAKCADVLSEKTGQRLGFEPAGPPDERAAAIRRWRAWLELRASGG